MPQIGREPIGRPLSLRHCGVKSAYSREPADGIIKSKQFSSL
nr:MAG TPA: hypothetical protein [Bacteriophage sp.]